MSVPSRVEAAAIVASLRPPDHRLQHSTSVAEIAAFLCSAMVRQGVAVDSMLTEAAALLHDVDKMLAKDEPLKPLGHARAGAAWLREHGYPELSDAVEQHPVMELGRAASYEAWSERAGLCGRIVAYSDKRAKLDLVSLDERFAEWHRRYPDSPPLFVAQERAHRLEHEVCDLAGVQPADVARQAWVAEAMRGAA